MPKYFIRKDGDSSDVKTSENGGGVQYAIGLIEGVALAYISLSRAF